MLPSLSSEGSARQVCVVFFCVTHVPLCDSVWPVREFSPSDGVLSKTVSVSVSQQLQFCAVTAVWCHVYGLTSSAGDCQLCCKAVLHPAAESAVLRLAR
jgi:hypothetical protein